MKIQFYQHQIDKLVNHLKTELNYDVYPMTSKKDLEEILNVIMFGNKFMNSNDKGEKKQYVDNTI